MCFHLKCELMRLFQQSNMFLNMRDSQQRGETLYLIPKFMIDGNVILCPSFCSVLIASRVLGSYICIFCNPYYNMAILSPKLGKCLMLPILRRWEVTSPQLFQISHLTQHSKPQTSTTHCSALATQCLLQSLLNAVS